ncbi:hypothetical protein FNO01nite_32060 [Flavobacterium noncentrifugens]|uniref:Chaperone of endosialidase n=1 Tax=Flavobacterium noncentrifugens TaxID=1128970 RepID=A0A1G9D0W9_9FLAO|nr:tail fiber domain-containing protein [Flavobacterium noncentrifugens]GEP52534.1 hypothetical protein FNO01nite_32060 [Flavobacterium noncentrifugens]SDK57562.1 Chaperone of endosialidase [Flavobacterium noncentrifugens]
MRKFCFLLIFFANQLNAQVGINTTTPLSTLDIRANDPANPTNADGLMIPRVDSFPFPFPTASQQGMLIYLTTTFGLSPPGFYFWDNIFNSWLPVGGRNWKLGGNTDLLATDFIGSMNQMDIKFKRYNIGSGIISEFNTAFGYNSLNNTIFSYSNCSAFGAGAMSNHAGTSNTAIGANALQSYGDSSYNTAIGNESQAASGFASNHNTSVGYRTLAVLTVNGNDNVAIGSLVLGKLTAGNSNVAVGSKAFENLQNGFDNTAIGYKAMNLATGTNGSTAIGSRALEQNMFGNYNTAVGYIALNTNNGSNNTAIGYQSLSQNNGGSDNTAVGSNAMLQAQGFENTAVGKDALYSNANGNRNTAVGKDALYMNNLGQDNTAVGNSALKNNNVNQNSAFGKNALLNNDFGTNNNAFGFSSLLDNTSGNNNVSMGSYALGQNQTASGNTAIGNFALAYHINGDDNTAIGNNAFSGNGNFSNSTAIGANSDITANKQVRIGDSNVTSIGGFSDWTNISDGRFKMDVKANVPGLAFIGKLRPVTYHLNMQAINAFRKHSNSSENRNELQTGFIAQEVEQAAIDSGFDFSGVDRPKNDSDYYGLRYAQFVVPLVKAVQEQQQIIEKQQREIELLKLQVNQNDYTQQAVLQRLAALEQKALRD